MAFRPEEGVRPFSIDIVSVGVARSDARAPVTFVGSDATAPSAGLFD